MYVARATLFWKKNIVVRDRTNDLLTYPLSYSEPRSMVAGFDDFIRYIPFVIGVNSFLRLR